MVSHVTTGIIGGTVAQGRVRGANERIRAGVMGLNGRGWALVQALHATRAEITALCEPDANVLERRAAEAEQLTGRRPAVYQDIRALLAAGDTDVLCIAAPNHWHTLAAIWAMEAGKDVYVEKPVSHTVAEGRQLLLAQQRTGRIVQHGTQRRSEPYWQRLIQRAKGGIIGEIYMVRCICHQPRPAVAYPPQEAPPPFLDWTLWQGPAPEQGFSRNYVHYNWHWFWQYGNGEIGNNIVHFADIANWLLEKGLPVEVYSEGGRFGYRDAAETPNTQIATCRFADGTLLVNEVRNRYSNSEGGARGQAGTSVGILFYGSDGHMVNGRFFDKRDRPIREPGGPGIADATNAHMAAFLNAVKERQPILVPATAEQGHVAASICHLANISYRLGRSLRFDPATERFPGDEEANQFLTRAYRPGFEVV